MRGEVARWDYKDKTGHVLGYVSRFEDGSFKESGKPSKEIKPYFKPDGNGFKVGLPDSLKENRPLYGLDRLNDPLKLVYIVEGEKCASALNDLGFQAVTSLGGSEAVLKADWKALRDIKQAVILPDNDKAGNRYGKMVYKRLKAVNPAIDITIAEFPDLPIGGDVCDFLKANYSELFNWDTIKLLNDHPFKDTIAHGLKADFKAFNQPVPVGWQTIESGNGLKALSYKALNAMNLPERAGLLKPWLCQRSINMVFADRGIGKTYFCLSCAIALAEGNGFIKYEAYKPVKVLYLDGEMQANLIRERIRSLTSNEALVNDNLYIVTPDCQHERDMPNLARAEGLAEVDEIIRQVRPDVIVVDNLSTFIRSGKENEGESWLPVQEWAIRQRSAGRAVVFVHHTNKEGTQRGSSRKEDVMDVVIRLKRPEDYVREEDGARFEIHFTKARNLYGEDIQPIEAKLELQDNKQIWTWKSADGDYGQAIELIKAGYSQKEVCEELGIAKATMSRWTQKARSEGLL